MIALDKAVAESEVMVRSKHMKYCTAFALAGMQYGLTASQVARHFAKVRNERVAKRKLLEERFQGQQLLF